MKKRYIPFIISAAFLIVLVIISIIFLYANKQEEFKISIDTNNKIVAKSNIKTPDKFTLKSINNEIFLYDNKNNVIKKIDINYNLLRDYDKKQFKNGIVVSSLEEVFQIIEDFSS